MELSFPPSALAALDVLIKSGHDASIVGGAVRDALLGRAMHDIDLATDATPEEIIALFPGRAAKSVGKAFGTVQLSDPGLQITTFRTEGAYLDARRPSEVAFGSSLVEDLSRRDFTVNAMAYSPQKGLTDPFGGRVDLQNRLLRAVGDPGKRFSEDALRILRAIRFAATLRFEIETETKLNLFRYKNHLALLSAQRITEELTRILLSQGAAEILVPYRSILSVILPEVFSQEEASIRTIAQTISLLPPLLPLRLAALFLFTELDQAKAMLLRLSYPKRVIRRTLHIRAFLDDPLDCAYAAHHALTRFETDLLLKGLSLRQSVAEVRIDDRERILVSSFEQDIRRLVAESAPTGIVDLAVDGQDLLREGYVGKEIKTALHALLRAVVEKRAVNERADLLRYLAANRTEGIPSPCLDAGSPPD